MIIRPNFKKKDQIRYPSFNRNRLATRAPIRSELINLEDHQLSYDIANINSKESILKAKMDACNKGIEGDVETSGTINYVIKLLANYDKRLKALEEN